MRMILALLLFVCGATPLAAEMTQVEDLMGCRTLEQAKQFAGMGADQSAMDAVNQASGAEVCEALRVSFLKIGPVGDAHHNNDVYIIIEIGVYGVADKRGMHRLKTPTLWYVIANAKQTG